MAFGSELLRGGGEEEDRGGLRGEVLDDLIGLAWFGRMPLEVVGFVDDEQVKSGSSGLDGAVGVFGEKLGGTEDVLAVVKGVGLGFEFLDGLAAFLIEDGEEEVEAAEELDEPLVGEWFGDENENAVGASGEVEAVENEAGFDRFAEADFVGKEKSRSETGGCFGGDGELVGDEVDAGTDESTGGGTTEGGVLFECPGAEVEVAEFVALAGEESVLGFEKAE